MRINVSSWKATAADVRAAADVIVEYAARLSS
jgi:hypothetical protein